MKLNPAVVLAATLLLGANFSSAQSGNWELGMFVCERIQLNLTMEWGQSPEAIGSSRPGVSGTLPVGTSFALLGDNGTSGAERVMRIQILGGGQFGGANNRVWVFWSDNKYSQQAREIAFECVE